MWHGSRRDFLKATAGSLSGLSLGLHADGVLAQLRGDRPRQDRGIRVLNPQLRVPVSLIIDDSTCLVNLNRFAVPQFATAWGNGERYRQPWRDWPAEIPDRFVRSFGTWCRENGVKGKYSVVPYPACVGRLDRLLPGWTQRELRSSLDLVRTLMMPDWDIHPEMVTHTWVIDTRTGHPYPEQTPRYQENWDWTNGRSVDELANYMSYALRILRTVELPCEGITTPGGFGNRVLPELAQATLQSCRDVFRAEIPHYFRHLYDRGDQSVAPRIEYAADLEGNSPRCVVSIIGCTGDWTGGWDCSDRGSADRFITEDLSRGRLVQVIDRGEPAALVSHWTGIYFNGEEVGFRVFQEVVRRLRAKYGRRIQWMKLSEIARYWAAKELTRLEKTDNSVRLLAPFACPRFTLEIIAPPNAVPRLTANTSVVPLRETRQEGDLEEGRWLRQREGFIICFNLPRGQSVIEW